MFDFLSIGDPEFTKSMICKKLGLPNSRSYFSDVLKGKFLSPLKTPVMAKVFGLSADETKFFRTLVNFNQAFDDPNEKDILFEQLLTMSKPSATQINPKAYDYYRTWHHCVVRALLDIVDVSDNWADLAGLTYPKISKSEVNASKKLLIDLGIIARNENGFWKPNGKSITTGSFMRDQAILQFQTQILEMAQKAIINNSLIGQRVKTLLMTLSEDSYKRVLGAIDRFNNELTTIATQDENPADRIYQLALVLFPYSQGSIK